jgi:hypothetical protein
MAVFIDIEAPAHGHSKASDTALAPFEGVSLSKVGHISHLVPKEATLGETSSISPLWLRSRDSGDLFNSPVASQPETDGGP